MNNETLILVNGLDENNKIEIMPNMATWEDSYEYSTCTPIKTSAFTYISLRDDDELLSVGLSLEDTKKLIEFLQTKIDTRGTK